MPQSQGLEAIILAGGKGTRLQSVVRDVPKPMAPICGRPFLEVLLRHLSRQGVTRAILSVGYMADVVIDHFGEEFCGVSLQYAIEETALGTGGALAMSLPLCTQDHALVLNGDTFFDFDLALAEDAWQTHHLPVIVLREVDDTARYGRVEFKGGRINHFAEKGIGGRGLINSGCYVLPTDLFAQSQLQVPFSFETDFLALAVPESPIVGIIAQGDFIDIGIPEDFALAQTKLRPFLQ